MLLNFQKFQNYRKSIVESVLSKQGNMLVNLVNMQVDEIKFHCTKMIFYVVILPVSATRTLIFLKSLYFLFICFYLDSIHFYAALIFCFCKLLMFIPQINKDFIHSFIHMIVDKCKTVETLTESLKRKKDETWRDVKKLGSLLGC